MEGGCNSSGYGELAGLLRSNCWIRATKHQQRGLKAEVTKPQAARCHMSDARALERGALGVQVLELQHANLRQVCKESKRGMAMAAAAGGLLVDGSQLNAGGVKRRNPSWVAGAPTSPSAAIVSCAASAGIISCARRVTFAIRGHCIKRRAATARADGR